MKSMIFGMGLIWWFLTNQLQAGSPILSNVRASQISGTKNIETLYDVSDTDGDSLTIAIQISGDGGQTYTIPATALSGNIGPGVTPGINRRIVWNAGVDWDGQLVLKAKVRLSADDGYSPAPPPGMKFVPGGVFQMGDNLYEEHGSSALPVHNVVVSGYFMDQFEVKKELWDSVLAWASGHGYSFYYLNQASASGNGHPLQNVAWYDAVIWCNARSEMEGLIPCYYTNFDNTEIYKSGRVDLNPGNVKWNANGYRLPTEAEWEKAARGGLFGQRYPWGNSINGSQANLANSGDPFEEGNLISTTPVGYYNGGQLPPGVDMANGYGLYDMAGNVSELCWDFYSESFYGDPLSRDNPRGPRGPGLGIYRVSRGGSYLDSLQDSPLGRVAQRASASPPTQYQVVGPGFRCVRKGQ